MKIEDLKEMVKNCVYEEENLVCMSSEYYRKIIKNTERLNNKINSIFSNFEQFIDSYKNDTLDDFFIGLRLSEVVEFYNDLKEVIKNDRSNKRVGKNK